MKKVIFLIIFCFVITGCYTTLPTTSSKVQTNDVPKPTSIHKIVAIDSKGDTVEIGKAYFIAQYRKQPLYYAKWRFYHKGMWKTPQSYYWTRAGWYSYNYYYPKQTIIIQTESGTKETSTSKPRSTGTTSSNKNKRPTTTNPERNKTNATPKSRSN